MKRISEKKVWEKTSYNHCFSDSSIINSELMAENDGWREILHDKKLTFYGIFEQLDNYYDLDSFVPKRLMFRYES